MLIHRLSITEAFGNTFASFNNTLYILATYADHHPVLLRILAQDLLEFRLDSLEGRSSSLPGWTTYDTMKNMLRRGDYEPYQLFSHDISDASLHYHSNQLIIVSLNMVEQFLRICQLVDMNALNTTTAWNWRCDQVFVVDPKYVARSLFSYAGKAHPHLLQPSYRCEEKKNMVVSYVTNALPGPNLLFEKSRLYRNVYSPKFVYLQQK